MVDFTKGQSYHMEGVLSTSEGSAIPSTLKTKQDQGIQSQSLDFDFDFKDIFVFVIKIWANIVQRGLFLPKGQKKALFEG